MLITTELNRTPLPSIIMSNVQSLRSKIDDLQAMVRFQHDYKDACILALTETWLKSSDPGNSVIIDGFGIPFRTDRCPRVTGKKQGGGVCLYINHEWCSSVTVRESVCTKDIELLCVASATVSPSGISTNFCYCGLYSSEGQRGERSRDSR